MQINRDKLLDLKFKNKGGSSLSDSHARAISVLMREIPSFSFDMPLPRYFALLKILQEENEEYEKNKPKMKK